MYALEVLQNFKNQKSTLDILPSTLSHQPGSNDSINTSKIKNRHSIFDILPPSSSSPATNGSQQPKDSPRAYPGSISSPFSLRLGGGDTEEVSFHLYGSIYSQPYWADCQNIIRSLPGWINVTYHGPLDSEQVPEKLSRAHFLFMPTRGENYGHVILESLAAGCPVLISDQTPWRNLQQKGIGWDIALNDTAAFTSALTACLTMDQATYNHMSKTAYKYAQQVINDPSVLEANRKLFE